MNMSFSIGRLFGIEVRVHLLFLYMALMLILLVGTPLTTLVALVTLFSLVLLHELGHSLVARHFGIRVIDIVLWPLGGMARMSEIPEDPKIEAWVAIAGPLVNIALAVIGALLLIVLGSIDQLLGDPLSTSNSMLAAYLALFTWMNVMMGVFNLVPAFPMDGGRLLRALLARRRSYLEATRIAVKVGQIIALMMIFSVFLYPANCTLPLIGLFVLWTGAQELWSVRIRHQFASAQQGPFGFPGSAGPGPFGATGGALNLQQLLRAMSRRSPESGEAPSQHGGDAPDLSSSTGFSDADLRRLEQDRGRLRRPPDED